MHEYCCDVDTALAHLDCLFVAMENVCCYVEKDESYLYLLIGNINQKCLLDIAQGGQQKKIYYLWLYKCVAGEKFAKWTN